MEAWGDTGYILWHHLGLAKRISKEWQFLSAVTTQFLICWKNFDSDWNVLAWADFSFLLFKKVRVADIEIVTKYKQG
jgi:hypothetical protein